MGKIYKNGIEYGGGGGSSGHTILDNDGNTMPTEDNLQFKGLDVTDNSTDGVTEVESAGLNQDSLDDVLSASASGVQVASNGMSYSTEEQVVGRWIDGKPLYQKTVDCGALPNRSTKNIAHNITDADLVFIQNAFGFYPNGNQTTILPTSQDQTGKGLQLFVDRTNISIYCREYDLSDYSQSYVTIQYTKTTD